MKEAADRLGVSAHLFKKAMEEHGIQCRTFKENAALLRRRKMDARGASGVCVAPPAPGARCEYVSSSSKVASARCQNPPLAANARYCATHAVDERNAGTKNVEKLALTLAQTLTVACARCEWSEDVLAGDAAQRFRQHRFHECPATTEDEFVAEVERLETAVAEVAA